MNKYLLLIILLVTGLTGARAQYDSQLSQYFMALGYYNPAYAGVDVYKRQRLYDR